MPKPEIKEWYAHEHPQSIFVMFTKELMVVWWPSGIELRRIYLRDPDQYVSGPLELPIPDEVNEAIDQLFDKF